ncbi:MAG: VOC family protein [Eubacteriales bacterium]
MRINISDVCFITQDVQSLVGFYEKVLQVKAEGDEIHSVFELDGVSLVIYSKDAAQRDMLFDFSVHNGSGTTCLGVNVDDADEQYERLKGLGVEFVTTPKTYPWGARSFHFRDLDGNMVTFRTTPNK